MSTPLDALQSLVVPPVTMAALTLAVVALVVSDPVLGRRDHRAFLAAVAAGPAAAPGAPPSAGTSDGEDARLRLYRRWVRMGWVWAVTVVALVAVLPGVGLDALGLRAPDLSGLALGPGAAGGEGGSAGGAFAGMLAGMVTGALAVTLVPVALGLLGRRRARSGGADARPDRSLPLAGAAALAPMLPTTARGRRGWAALAVTAGVTEEVTYRGLVLLTLALLLPTAAPVALVAAAAVVFGLAHAYQGRVGMLATGLAGAVFAWLYLSTGSLLLPMVLHVLVDLRVLLLPPGAPRAVDRPVTQPQLPA